MEYMIIEISCWIIPKKNAFFQFSLFWNSNFVVFFLFWAKNTQNYKSCQKKAKIIKLPYYLTQEKIHFFKSTFFLWPLTWNHPWLGHTLQTQQENEIGVLEDMGKESTSWIITLAQLCILTVVAYEYFLFLGGEYCLFDTNNRPRKVAQGLYLDFDKL